MMIQQTTDQARRNSFDFHVAGGETYFGGGIIVGVGAFAFILFFFCCYYYYFLWVSCVCREAKRIKGFDKRCAWEAKEGYGEYEDERREGGDCPLSS